MQATLFNNYIIFIIACIYNTPSHVAYIIFYFCVDINECNDPRICGYNQKCTNIAGSYICECFTGYEPDTRSLTNDDTYYHCTGK